MKNEDKPKEQLIKELEMLKKQNLDLKQIEIESKHAQNIISGLYGISSVVSSEANLDELFKVIQKHLGTITDTSNFFIGLYDKKSDLISFPYFIDEKDNKFVILKVSESGSLSARVIKTKKPFIIKKEEFKKRLAKKDLQLWGTLPEIWLGVPLKIKDEVIGVLGMQSYSNPDLYSEEDIALMESISDQIAIAIDHKRAGEALKESEEKWRSLVENAPDIIMTIDPEGTIQFTNYTAIGLKPEEVIGKNVLDFIQPEHHEIMNNSLKHVLETGEPVSYELTGTGRHGKTAWYGSRLGPIMRDGEIIALTLITSDITKRKQAEEELRKHQEQLEELVKERTFELTKANEQLQQDIIERWKTQSALSESEEKYRNLVERANDGIAIIQDMVVKYINPALAIMLGYSVDEIINKKFHEYLHPDELPKVEERYKRRMKGEEVPAVYETGVIHKDGHKVEIELNAGVITYEGKPADLVLVRNIMERKQAEEKLRDSEERFRLLFENISDVVFVFNSELVLTNITPTVEDMSGYKPEELIGRSFADLDFLTPESLQQAFGAAEKIFAGEDVGYLAYEFISKDGTKRFAEVNNTPVFHEGELVEFVAVARDITKRKQAEEALLESEELYKSLVKTSPDAVTATDMDGNIIFASPRTLELHGYDEAAELLGKSAFKLISPEDHERAIANLQNTIEDGIVRNQDYTMIKKDGSTFIGELSAALIKDAHGKPKSFIASVKDITERKNAEKQIKESLEEKEVLLREIHHRVKNNIQVITSMLSLHTSYVKNKEYIETFNEIQNRIKSMALIHEKLYESKDLAHIDFNEYINDLINSLFRFYGVNINKVRPKINVGDVSISIDSAIPCGLIINELVSNSLKHAFPLDKSEMKENEGEIRIELTSEKDDTISLIVSDNGSGFPSDVDFRATETFGLQLVIILVDQLDGSIKLKSNNNDNKLTEFKISFNERIEN